MKVAIRRILCPIDMSPYSGEALRYAIALARAYDAKLLVYHCVRSYSLDGELREREIDRMIEGLIDHPQDRLSPLNWGSVVVEGDPADLIPREAARRNADLIVMRTRQRPLSALIGSTAEAVSRNSPCPVLVIPSSDRSDFARDDISLKRILAAYDISKDSELALAWALSLAQEYQAELHLLHVLPELAEFDMSRTIGGGWTRTTRVLKKAIPQEARLWADVTEIVKFGKPYREILAYAVEHKIDLVCMGVSGAGFGLNSLFGSNTDRVLRQAPCPVLTVRPQNADRAITAWPQSISMN